MEIKKNYLLKHNSIALIQKHKITSVSHLITWSPKHKRSKWMKSSAKEIREINNTLFCQHRYDTGVNKREVLSSMANQNFLLKYNETRRAPIRNIKKPVSQLIIRTPKTWKKKQGKTEAQLYRCSKGHRGASNLSPNLMRDRHN